MIQIPRASVMSIARARAGTRRSFQIFRGRLGQSARADPGRYDRSGRPRGARDIADARCDITRHVLQGLSRARTIRAKRAAAVLVAARQSSKRLWIRERRGDGSWRCIRARTRRARPRRWKIRRCHRRRRRRRVHRRRLRTRDTADASSVERADAMLLGLRPKSGVDGGRGLGEFHVIVSQTASRTVGEAVDLFRRACVIEHSIENAAGYDTVCRRRGGDEGAARQRSARSTSASCTS